jgi:hypothetical protein
LQNSNSAKTNKINLAVLIVFCTFTAKLKVTKQCDFIRSYYAFGKNKQDKIYQLIDLFSLFYINFIHNKNNHDEQFWTNNFRTATLNTWRGYAFEQVCLWHIPQID